MYFQYLSGTTTIDVNCQTSEIRREGVIDSSIFTAGNFIKLVHGANAFQYISDQQPNSIAITYRRNYIV